MTGDDAPRFLGDRRRHSHLDAPERHHGHRPDGLRVTTDAERTDAVAVEKGHDDAGLDVGGRVEDDDRGARLLQPVHAAAGNCRTLTTRKVMSSCCSDDPEKSITAVIRRSRSSENGRSANSRASAHSLDSPKKSPAAFMVSVTPSVYSKNTSPVLRGRVHSTSSPSNICPSSMRKP